MRVERDTGMCVARGLYELWGRSPLHPHVCGPHVALEVGDHLMLTTDQRGVAKQEIQEVESAKRAGAPYAHHRYQARDTNIKLRR